MPLNINIENAMNMILIVISQMYVSIQDFDNVVYHMLYIISKKKNKT